MRVQTLPKEGYVTNHQYNMCVLNFSLQNCVCDRSALESGTSWNPELFNQEMERSNFKVNC
jgi:hypothetical protein